MDLGLNGKIALVSGASRGIGNRIALALAEEGARLCICARNQEGLEKAKAEIEALGAEVEAVVADLSEASAGKRFVEAAVSRFGGVDILINNVGGSVWTPFAEIADDEWSHVFELSFFSAVRVARAAFPVMEKGGGGSIVNISSIFGRESGGPVSYNAAKAAMISMTANLAIEAAPKNIRVNSVHPGVIDTPMTKDLLHADEETRKALLGPTLMNRPSTPDEVSKAVLFLASDESSFVHGAEIVVDGGYTAN